MTGVVAHIIYAQHARKNNGHFFFHDFLDSCIEISDRVYGKAFNESDKKVEAQHMADFCVDFFDALLDHLVDLKKIIQSAHVPFLDKEDGEEMADILSLAYEGLDKIFQAYMRCTGKVQKHKEIVVTSSGLLDPSVDGWSLRDWNKFIKDFKLHRVTKTLPLNRVFFVYAVDINNCCDLDSTDAFVDSIVLVAERMILANKLDSSRDRLIWLLHHIHSIAPVTLVAHLRPLFPGLPARPDHLPKPKVRTGWRSVLKTLKDEGGFDIQPKQETKMKRSNTHGSTVRGSKVSEDKQSNNHEAKQHFQPEARFVTPLDPTTQRLLAKKSLHGGRRSVSTTSKGAA
jgi:hypothetical protein